MNEGPTIAVLAPYKVYPAVSGGERYIALLYRHLSAVVPVTMLSVDVNRPDNIGSMKHVGIMGTSKFRYANPFLFFRIRKYIRGNNISHFFIVHPYFAWLGVLIKYTTKAKFVIQSHNIEGLRFKTMARWWWFLLYRYESWAHRQADTSFFVTAEDMEYAVKHFKADPSKCFVATYGTEIPGIPANEERATARQRVLSEQNLERGQRIILFNGILDYRPNIEAVDFILSRLNAELLALKDFRYTIIICGKNLPDAYGNLEAYRKQNIVYAGFVKDIRAYFLGSDVFINPVNSGGGIKTKLVEALGYNLTSVSTATGANGVPIDITGGKLTIVPDEDPVLFAAAICKADLSYPTPAGFFDHFYWPNIAMRMAKVLNKDSERK